MSPAFIYFDLDDTLLNHKKAERSALLDLQQAFDFLSSIEPEHLITTYHRINRELWERYGKGSLDKQTLKRERFRRTLESLSLDSSKHEITGEHYMQRYQKHWSWIDGAAELLQTVSRHFGVGILTNGFSEVQKKKIGHFELNRFASHIVISEEVGYLKPQPEIFQHATSLAGVPPNQILYIGDSYQSDILGGSRFGWKTGWYTPNQAEDNRHADFVLQHLDDLKIHLNI